MNTTNPDKQQPQWPKESPFTVPDGYFDELSESILCRRTIHGKKYRILCTCLKGLHLSPYLKIILMNCLKIMARTSSARKGRRVDLNVIKYAAAVVVISGVALLTCCQGNESASNQVSMEQLSEDEITTYLLKNAGG